MKEIWTKEELVPRRLRQLRSDVVVSGSRVQKPNPPVLLGGESGYTLQRVVDFCEGWFPRGRNPRPCSTASPTSR